MSFGPPLAKLWPNTFQYISIYFMKSWFALVCHQLDQTKQKYFRGGFALGYLWPLGVIGCNAGTPSKKGFLLKIHHAKKLDHHLGFNKSRLTS